MRPEQGDIVLIPVPFTDLSSHKRRPAIVVSNDDHNVNSEDIIVVAMTSNPIMRDYSFGITSADLSRGQLKRPSVVHVDKIYTLSQLIVLKVFGQVDAGVLDRIRGILHELLG